MDKNKENMKPQDLRIGNYVRIKESGNIVQVDSISRLDIRYFDESCLRYKQSLISCGIEPVLIREVYDKLPYIKDLLWEEYSEWYAYRYKGIPIAYLHQLQNIHYVLTGNEIEIEI